MTVPTPIVEQEEMGRVLTEALVENLRDLFAVDESRAQPEEVRRARLTDALVDTGATTLALPARYIRQSRRLIGNPAHGGEQMLEVLE